MGKTCILHTYNSITDKIYHNICFKLDKICVLEFLFKTLCLYKTFCSESATTSLAEYFYVYLNIESAESMGDRPMSSSLPKSVVLLYFPDKK